MAILLVDDQEHCIARLVTALRIATNAGMPIDYVSSSNEAIQTMKDVAYSGRAYQALVVDFNMDGINGKQLLQVVTGRVEDLRSEASTVVLQHFADVAEQALRTVIEENFDSVQEYRAFCFRHQQLVKILFSGGLFGDGVNDLPNDIPFVLKSADAELRVAHFLYEGGVLSEQGWRNLLRYWRRIAAY